ncbi:sugar phosphate isomerase/epimerase family protein [Rudanella lutea]|uniref:sugar phosphate isomerase/epimerase family protein n=1 Tax=Rudanella lutea TaxID=451374 RepID=UPI0003A0686A|nr:sugar phosphate isomerase/epimerase [Rudanella lutea]
MKKTVQIPLVSRRRFLALAPLSLGLSWVANGFPAGGKDKPNSKFGGVQIGVITYSYRTMPGDLHQLIQYCVDSNVSAIELMGDPAEEFLGKPEPPFPTTPLGPGRRRPPLTEEQKTQLSAYNKQVAEWRLTLDVTKFREVRRVFADAGISIYAFKPIVFGVNNSDAEVEYGIRAAKELGAKSVTVELPTDPAQSLRLGKLGEKHKVYIGYHNHLQATDTLWDNALSQSPYNSINFDCGHYLAAGGANTRESLMSFLEDKHERITSMHLKDRTTPANGQKNLVWGSGDTPIREILLQIKKRKYNFPVTVELEYEIPEGSNAVKEVARCVEYAKKILI